MATALVQDKSSIVEKVVFVRVSFGTMGNSRKVGNSVLNTDADTKFLKVQKALLDSPELDAIKKLDGQLRTYLYSMCLPYDTGFMMLPHGLLETVNARIEQHDKERKELVDAFINAYPHLCANAATKLGSLHNPQDYPTPELVRSKFYFEYQYLSFAVPEALKVAGIYETMNAKMKDKLEQASEEITLLMRQTLLDLVDHLKVSLEPNAEGKPKRLFSSAVTNVQDFLKTFKDRNITNDAELEKLVEETHKLIQPGLDIDMLRSDESFKNQVHEGMSNISSQLNLLVEVVPGRKFKALEE